MLPAAGLAAALLLVGLSSPGGASAGRQSAEAGDWQPASVASLSARVLDSIPAQVEVTLGGTLPDACTRVGLVEETSRLEVNRILLAIEAVRPTGNVCVQVFTPYRLRLVLDASALSPGDYVIESGGIEAPFTIEPVGDFPVLSLGLFESDSRVIVPVAGLALIGPGDWERHGLLWTSPPFWAARIGLRWHSTGVEPVSLLPDAATVHESSQSRLGWEIGVRHRVSREQETLWSEHLFVACSASTLCEFWMEAPSEPLLEAAGESFWRMVRFAARVPAEQLEPAD